MENIIEAITDNPVYLAIAVILAIVIVYGFIKKIIKLVLVTASIFVLYICFPRAGHTGPPFGCN